MCQVRRDCLKCMVLAIILFFGGGRGGGLRCLSQISIDEVKAGQSCFDLNNEIFSLKFGSTAWFSPPMQRIVHSSPFLVSLGGVVRRRLSFLMEIFWWCTCLVSHSCHVMLELCCSWKERHRVLRKVESCSSEAKNIRTGVERRKISQVDQKREQMDYPPLHCRGRLSSLTRYTYINYSLFDQFLKLWVWDAWGV